MSFWDTARVYLIALIYFSFIYLWQYIVSPSNVDAFVLIAYMQYLLTDYKYNRFVATSICIRIYGVEPIPVALNIVWAVYSVCFRMWMQHFNVMTTCMHVFILLFLFDGSRMLLFMLLSFGASFLTHSFHYTVSFTVSCFIAFCTVAFLLQFIDTCFRT